MTPYSSLAGWLSYSPSVSVVWVGWAAGGGYFSWIISPFVPPSG